MHALLWGENNDSTLGIFHKYAGVNEATFHQNFPHLFRLQHSGTAQLQSIARLLHVKSIHSQLHGILGDKKENATIYPCLNYLYESSFNKENADNGVSEKHIQRQRSTADNLELDRQHRMKTVLQLLNTIVLNQEEQIKLPPELPLSRMIVWHAWLLRSAAWLGSLISQYP